MTRAPVFAARSVAHAAEIVHWVEAHLAELQTAADATTRHGRLVGATCSVAGTSVFVRFEFTTGDAMGMNMVTIASEAASAVVERETGARLVALSGNLCTDKKPAAVNAVSGRGRTVAAGVLLPTT